ncbi:MAG: hypothetical protein IKW60_04045 [Clostridia bacterium]|nr:hypothetical protein [Clostridia bacterium]
MIHNDTIELLKECNAGVKMGVTSIDDVLDKVKSEKLKGILHSSKEKHQELGSGLHELLNRYEESGKDPNPVARGMSWIKTNVMMSMDDSDRTVADLMTDGCDMGVKSLTRYLNQYQAADEDSKNMAKDLISLEERLRKDLQPFL